MKLPRRFVTKLSLATVLAASAGLGWATPDAMAGLVLSAPVVTTDQSGEGDTVVEKLPAPVVFATTTLSGTAQAIMGYNFVYEGPPGEMVPIDVSSTLSYDTQGMNRLSAWIAQAGIFVSGGPSGDRSQSILGESGAPQGSRSALPAFSDPVKLSYTVPTNTLINVSIFAFVSDLITTGTHPPHSLVDARADPVISIAPGFDSTGLTLVLPPGVGNSFDSGVEAPEPSTLVMSAIVFGMFGVVWAYKQRKRTSSAA